MSANTSYHRRHRHSHSEDTKKEKILKYIFSFIAFLFLTLLSVLICTKAVIINPVFIEKSFTTYEYTVELYRSIEDFSESTCKKYNIDSYAVENVVNFEAVKQLNDAFVSENLKTDGKFNNETYDFFIGNLKSELKSQIERQMQSSSVEVTNDVENGIDVLINDIIDYINNAVRVSHIDKIYPITSVADTALQITCAVVAVITGTLIVIVCYIGEKRYRGVRYAAYSVGGLSLINAVFAVIVSVYYKYKSAGFAIYPNYLMYALENHIGNLVLALFCASVSSFAVFVILLAICWKLKRKNK